MSVLRVHAILEGALAVYGTLLPLSLGPPTRPGTRTPPTARTTARRPQPVAFCNILVDSGDIPGSQVPVTIYTVSLIQVARLEVSEKVSGFGDILGVASGDILEDSGQFLSGFPLLKPPGWAV